MKREKENIPNQNNSTVIGNDPNINYSESSDNVNKNESNYSNEQNKLRDLEYSLMIYLKEKIYFKRIKKNKQRKIL